MKRLLHRFYDLTADLDLHRVVLLHLVDGGHRGVNAPLCPGHGKGQMVGQRHDEVRVGLIGQLAADLRDLPGGKINHIQRDVIQQRQEIAVQVVEGALDLAERHFGRGLEEANAFAEYNNFLPFAVQTKRNVVVDILYYDHRENPPLNEKSPDDYTKR